MKHTSHPIEIAVGFREDRRDFDRDTDCGDRDPSAWAMAALKNVKPIRSKP